MTITDFLNSRGMTDADFASLVGVDRSTITRARKGTLNITRDVIRRIVDASDGEIAVETLVYPPAPLISVREAGASPDSAQENIGEAA